MLKVIVTLEDARAKGLKRYFTGKPCSNGHICERMVTNNDCVKCLGIRSSARYRKNAIYREKTKGRMRKNYENDPQKFRNRSNTNYLKTPENFRANAANRVARLKGIPGKITGADVLAILDLQGYECKYCGTSLHEKYEIDHAIALSKNGPNTIDNIQALCYRCHKNKTKQDLRDFFTKKEA